MRLKFVATSSWMSAKQLLRHRVAVALLIIIPTLFCVIIVLITPGRLITIQLPTIDDGGVLEVVERDETIVFIGLASVCLLTAFFALHLVQNQWDVDRRLILAGFGSSELLLSKLAVLGSLIVFICIYVSGLVWLFSAPRQYWSVVAGFIAGGYIYGCYGLMVGSLIKRELEGVLCVVLMSNIDSSWLQNPIIYAQAEQKSIIRLLPGFYPAQATMTGAFTAHSMLEPLVYSMMYGLVFLVIVLAIYALRMRIRVPKSTKKSMSYRTPHQGKIIHVDSDKT